MGATAKPCAPVYPKKYLNIVLVRRSNQMFAYVLNGAKFRSVDCPLSVSRLCTVQKKRKKLAKYR